MKLRSGTVIGGGVLPPPLELNPATGRKRIRSSSSFIGNLPDEVMLEILYCLPLRSVAQCRSTCKKWLSLASDPLLVRATYVNAFWIQLRGGRLYRVFPYDGNPHLLEDPSFNFVRGAASAPASGSEDVVLSIAQSCNGLLLVRLRPFRQPPSYFIANPLTLQQAPFPSPPLTLTVHGKPAQFRAYITFDPRRSSHYKAVAAFEDVPDVVLIYSSERNSWVPSRPGSLRLLFDADLHPACIYWKGALRRMKENGDQLLSLDLERDEMWGTPGPRPGRRVLYFGDSDGELLLIDNSSSTYASDRPAFDVWRLEEDYHLSVWSKKFHVDLPLELLEKFHVDLPLELLGTPALSFDILHCFATGKLEGQFIIAIGRTAIKYHHRNNTYMTLWMTAFPIAYSTYLYSSTVVFPYSTERQKVQGREEAMVVQ